MNILYVISGETKFKKNDEIIVTQLDHEANRGPWMSLKNYGIKINEIKLLKSGKLVGLFPEGQR